ncbi:MAG: proline dehydrogenase family protein [Crocinitomicaceae bacterium]
MDAEEYSTQFIFDNVVELMMEKFNKKEVIVYNTLQMYLTDRVDYLNKAIAEARAKGYLLGMKLVRGAYVEKEREYAKRDGVPSPVFDTKEGTDRSYDTALEICLRENSLINTCLATHNQASVELAVQLIEEFKIENHHQKIFFSQLYGMSDNLTFNLAASNYNSSKYVPYGEVEKAIPYLMRRAEENSSIEGQVGREYELLLLEKNRRK